MYQSLASVILLCTVAILFSTASIAQIPNDFPLPQGNSFVENRGQWNKSALFKLQTHDLDSWVTEQGIVFDLLDAGEYLRRASRAHLRGFPQELIGTDTGSAQYRRQAVSMRFVGARTQPVIYGRGKIDTITNYFVPVNDVMQSIAGVGRYDRVRMEGLYAGIDADLSVENGHLRYDLHLAPGIDPGTIRMQMEGADGMKVDEKGALVIATHLGDIRQEGLAAYQMIDGERRSVDCRFVIGSTGEVSFQVGAYDRRYELVIDPIAYSTFIGGSSQDLGAGIAVRRGNAYVIGSTASSDFPGSGYGDLNSNHGVLLVTASPFVAKLSTDGRSMDYIDFVELSLPAIGTSIAVDSSGNAYCTGYIYIDVDPYPAGRFPYTPSISRVLRTTPVSGDTDMYVFKLNAGGNSLLWATRFGGIAADFATGIAVDSLGYSYVTGFTFTTSGGNRSWPVTQGAYVSPSLGASGKYAGFIVRLDTNLSRFMYSGMIGLNGDDYMRGVAVNARGEAYVVGSCQAYDASGAQSFPPLGSLCVLNARGDTARHFILVGGGRGDVSYSGVAFDQNKNVYLAGYCQSYFYPYAVNEVVPLAGSTRIPVLDSTIIGYPITIGNYNAVMLKMNSRLDTVFYATSIGDTNNDYASGIGVDAAGSSYIAGRTASMLFPMTANGYDTTYGGSGDGFLTQLRADGHVALYSTFLGGSGTDVANGIAVDKDGNAYVVGSTTTSGFPVTSGSYDTAFGASSIKAFAMKMPIGSHIVGLSSPNGGESYCVGSTQTIRWSNTGVGAVRIDLSSDGGSTFPTSIVASTAAASGSYSWTIPTTLAQGSRYRIRVVDTATSRLVADTSDADFTINRLPAITTQPSSVTVCRGSSATFTVTATGGGVSYQWRKGGTNVAGATSATFTIASPQPSDSGSYDVVVSGACSPSVTSNPVTLTVNTPPAITAAPTNTTVCQGTMASFTVSATGSGLTYQWRKNSTPISGATSASYTIPATVPGDAGAYDVVVSGSCTPSVTSGTASLAVKASPSISVGPHDLAICPGERATFAVTAAGDGLTYQWSRDGVDIPGATQASYTIPAASTSDAGGYTVTVGGACAPALTSAPAMLILNMPPSILFQPTDASACLGKSVVFSVVASGTGLSYQWRRNGVDIQGATSATYTIPSVQSGDVGTYQAIVSGLCQPPVASSVAALEISNVAPSIRTQPAAQTICAGDLLTLHVAASGSSLGYRWRKNGTEISGATGPTYQVSSATKADAGSYDVVITSACATDVAVSQSADVQIDDPAHIVTQPSDATVREGESVTFVVAATGDNVTYQWRRNGVNIPGATSASYTIPSAMTSDAGRYDCVLTGSCPTVVTSNSATLTVDQQPNSGVDREAEPMKGVTMSIVPNPTSGRVRILIAAREDLSMKDLRMGIYDLRGALVVDIGQEFVQNNGHSVEVDLGALPSGTYVCRLWSGNRTVLDRTLVLQR